MAALFAGLEAARQFCPGVESLMLLLHNICLRIQPYHVHTTTTLAAPIFRATKAPTLRNRLFCFGQRHFVDEDVRSWA